RPLVDAYTTGRPWALICGTGKLRWRCWFLFGTESCWATTPQDLKVFFAIAALSGLDDHGPRRGRGVRRLGLGQGLGQRIRSPAATPYGLDSSWITSWVSPGWPFRPVRAVRGRGCRVA